MHVENMLTIADVIEKCEPRSNIHGWNMASFIQSVAGSGVSCETVGCAATWTVAVLEPDTFTKIEQHKLNQHFETAAGEVEEHARRILQLPKFAADFLFCAKWIVFYPKWIDRVEPLKNVQGAHVATIMREMVVAYGNEGLVEYVEENTHHSHGYIRRNVEQS